AARPCPPLHGAAPRDRPDLGAAIRADLVPPRLSPLRGASPGPRSRTARPCGCRDRHGDPLPDPAPPPEGVWAPRLPARRLPGRRAGREGGAVPPDVPGAAPRPAAASRPVPHHLPAGPRRFGVGPAERHAVGQPMTPPRILSSGIVDVEFGQRVTLVQPVNL